MPQALNLGFLGRVCGSHDTDIVLVWFFAPFPSCLVSMWAVTASRLELLKPQEHMRV